MPGRELEGPRCTCCPAANPLSAARGRCCCWGERRPRRPSSILDRVRSEPGARSQCTVEMAWAGAGTGNFKQNAGLSRSGLHHFEVETQVGRMHRSLSPRQTQFDDFQFMALKMHEEKMIEICELGKWAQSEESIWKKCIFWEKEAHDKPTLALPLPLLFWRRRRQNILHPKTWPGVLLYGRFYRARSCRTQEFWRNLSLNPDGATLVLI